MATMEKWGKAGRVLGGGRQEAGGVRKWEWVCFALLCFIHGGAYFALF
jgi:hypothetical protein